MFSECSKILDDCRSGNTAKFLSKGKNICRVRNQRLKINKLSEKVIFPFCQCNQILNVFYTRSIRLGVPFWPIVMIPPSLYPVHKIWITKCILWEHRVNREDTRTEILDTPSRNLQQFRDLVLDGSTVTLYTRFNYELHA